VGSSGDRTIARVQELIRRGALLDGGALITAEPGAGVEAVARELHLHGRHASAPYVSVDCDAGDPASVDRLLFGEPPPTAPTDLESVSADSCVAAARGGTLFLKNVTELRACAQAQVARSRDKCASWHADRYGLPARRERSPVSTW
jgi:DNA-binding NtrC family response regulator